MRAGRRNLRLKRSSSPYQREADMAHRPPVSLIIQEPDDHQTVRFRARSSNLLGSDPGNAITFAGCFLLIAAICMMWIHAPKAEEEIPGRYRPASSVATPVR